MVLLNWRLDHVSIRVNPFSCQISAVAHLLTEVLGSDAEHVQAHGGLVELGLKALQLHSLLLAAIPQLLDQSPVQLWDLFSLDCCRCPYTNYTTKYSKTF